MTTAHKPTFHPAVGSANQGGYRYYAPRRQVSSRDLPGQLTMKLRQPGQNTIQELQNRDLKAELEAKESAYEHQKNMDRAKQGLLPEPDFTHKAITHDQRNGKDGLLAIAYESSQLDVMAEFDDSDDPMEEDGDHDNTSAHNSNNSDIDSDDEEALLMAELEAIKKEKKLAKEREEEMERKRTDMIQEEAIRTGNPLMSEQWSGINMNNASKSNDSEVSFNLKKNWTEDTVFRNQAPTQPTQRRFINDTIRSDFHKKFMQRYIK